MCEQRELNHRIVISELFHVGKKTSDIIKDTGYASRTVYRIVSNLRKGKSIERKSHAPRADKIRTKRFLSGLKWSIAANPSQSMDEKKFVVDEVANCRNSWFIAKDPSCVPPVMQSKHPASVMVFGVVASDGKVMPPYFIDAGLKINTAEYLKILKEVLLPWIKKNYDPMKVMFIQDSAPAHGSKTVQKFLKRELPLFVPPTIWPSSLPDLNPCDYWLWGNVEKVSNAQPHSSVVSLKTSIR